MYQSINTLNGKYSFLAILANGQSYSELLCTWDDVPTYPLIKTLQFIQDNTVVFELSGYYQYYFSNMAVSSLSNNFTLVGKLFGAIKSSGEVTQIDIDILGSRLRTREKHFHVSQCMVNNRARRLGITHIT